MKRILSIFLLIVILGLYQQFVPSAFANNWRQIYYTFDSVSYGTSTSGTFTDAMAYADTSGLAKLYVYIQPVGYAEAYAWAQFEKRVHGNYTWVKPVVVFHANGLEELGGIKKITLIVIDSKTGEIKGKWSKDLRSSIGNYEDKLIGGWFVALGDRTYVYVIKVELHNYGYGIGLGIDIIDYYTGNHRIFINYLELDYSVISPETSSK